MSVFRLDQVQTLIAIFDEGSFERAARALNVTPSAVSQRIRAMEASTGSILVQRTMPARPTPAGLIALRYARQLALTAADADRALSASGEEMPTVSIPIAVNGDSLATWFLEVLAQLPPQAGMVFDLHRADQDFTIHLLREGKVMAAVTSRAQPVQGCTSEALGIMRYHAVCSPSYSAGRLGGRTRLEGSDPQAPMVSFDHSDSLQIQFLRDVLHRPVVPPSHFVPAVQDYADSVLLGLGWGLLPEQHCLEPLADGRLIDLSPERTIDVPLFWQRWKLASPLLDTLTDTVVSGARTRLRTPNAAGR